MGQLLPTWALQASAPKVPGTHTPLEAIWGLAVSAQGQSEGGAGLPPVKLGVAYVLSGIP